MTTTDPQPELFPMAPHTVPGPKLPPPTPHRLTILVDPDCDGCKPDAAPDDRCPEPCITYRLACPGITPDCESWEEVLDGLTDEQVEEAEQTGEIDGVPYQLGEDGWRTPAGACWPATADCLCDAAEDLAHKAQLGVGTYPVHVHQYDEHGFTLELAA